MKAMLHWWEMGSFPWLVPFRDGEDDPRRTIEVPDDLYERLVDAHEEFCAVLAEVDVECVEKLDAPHPHPVRLARGLVYPGGRYAITAPPYEGFEAECSRCGATRGVESPGSGEQDHARALAEVLSWGWRERRHGGLACPGCAPHEPLLKPVPDPVGGETGG